MTKTQTGVTLIELVIVMVIIGILLFTGSMQRLAQYGFFINLGL